MISIIIPVFNSEKTISVLVDDIAKTLGENYKFEIILVNDCSQDNSEVKCKELVSKFSNVTLLSLSKNVGEHNAIMAGLNNCSGECAVTMSDDLQHSTSALKELIEYGVKEKENFDVVYTYYDKKQDGIIKNFGRYYCTNSPKRRKKAPRTKSYFNRYKKYFS